MKFILKLVLFTFLLTGYNLFLKQLLIHQDLSSYQIHNWNLETYEIKKKYLKENSILKAQILTNYEKKLKKYNEQISQLFIKIPQ